MKKLPHALALIAFSLLLFPLSSEARTWTRAADGAKIEGEFVRMKDPQTVFIRRDGGAVVEVPVAVLSEADRAYLAEQANMANAPAAPKVPEGEAEVNLTGVHLCCGGCRRAVENAASAFEVEVATSGSTVTVKGKKGADVQQAIDAIADAGFYGESDHDTIKIAEVSGSEEGAAKVQVSQVHLCCGSCVDAVDEALSGLSGYQAHTASDGADSFEISGEGLKIAEVVAALRAKGLNGTVR